MSVPTTALVAAIISLLTSVLTVYVSYRLKERSSRRQEILTIKLTRLNPLRLYLEENFFRLDEIARRVQEGGGRCETLLYVSDPSEVSTKVTTWFNGEGCYLASSAYLTACLFFHLTNVRERIPYLALAKHEDTVLLNLVFEVRHAFLQDVGVFYATQPSIGMDMYDAASDRLVTYREFCESLQMPEKRIWFDRLFDFYLETGQGSHMRRVEDALMAIGKLSEFLDKIVHGGSSIDRRYESEGLQRRRIDVEKASGASPPTDSSGST